MCIAIALAKGLTVSEEALHNGWLNNDDGAGFVCLDDSGEFFIHKSMTWAGFWDTFKDAHAKWGATSDFLIHFRITSKGATSIDNCHPFKVDDERVIIHNGTMSKVVIEKGDERSDTKVFAEDYLPHMPKDWEDNVMCRLLIEEFIGASKICMLHKTKGIILFNQEFGLWDDGVWYSNASYKSKPVYNWKGNSKDWDKEYDAHYGFYSHTLKRMVRPDEAALMTPEEIKAHKDWKQNTKEKYSWDACDACGKFHDISELIEVTDSTSNSPVLWCSDCYATARYCDGCNKQFPENMIAECYDGINMTLYDFCNKCQDDYEISTGVSCTVSTYALVATK